VVAMNVITVSTAIIVVILTIVTAYGFLSGTTSKVEESLFGSEESKGLSDRELSSSKSNERKFNSIKIDSTKVRLWAHHQLL